MNCIAVDDEPLALDLIEDFINKVSFLKLIKKCNRASEAMEILQKENIDLVFLDIQMPNITGIQLIKSLQNCPQVIFTTAYTDYAVEGFELNVTDYIVKPFTFDRFLKAVNKAYSYYKLIKNNKSDTHPPLDYIFVKSDYQNVKINFDDILYIEGLSDYIKIYLKNNKRILTLLSLRAILEKLPENNFTRIHRSYIVSINKINSIQKNRIIIGDTRIPVGNHYKENFFKIINTNT